MNQWYERLVAPATTAGKWLRAGGALVVVAGVAVLFALTTGVWAKAPQHHQPARHPQAGQGQTTVIYACENNAGKVLSFNAAHQSCARHTQKVTVTIHYACLDVNSGKLLSFTTASALCSSSAKKVLLTQVGTGSLAPPPAPSPDASAVPDSSPVVVQPSPVVSHGYGAIANNVTLSRKGQQSVVAILSLPGGGYAVNAVVQVQTKVAGGSVACSVGSNKRTSGNGLQNSMRLTKGVATLSIVGTIITKASANLTVNCQLSNASSTVTILHATITVAQIDGVN